MYLRAKLLHSAAFGDIAGIKRCISSGAPIEYSFQRSPLHVAAQSGHLEAVKLLIKLGANPSNADEHDWIPLVFAADAGHLDVVKYLFKRSKLDPSPLLRAAETGHVDVVKFLIPYFKDEYTLNEALWASLVSRDFPTISFIFNHCDIIFDKVLSGIANSPSIEVRMLLVDRDPSDLIHFNKEPKKIRKVMLQCMISFFISPYSEPITLKKYNKYYMIENGFTL